MENGADVTRLKAEERRKKIIERLLLTDKPISGNRLANEFNVSRQVIVSDMGYLKKRYPTLVATSSGYVLLHSEDHRRIFKVNHKEGETEEELNMIVDHGGTVLDVYIEHRIYGTIRKPLGIETRADVARFMDDISSGASTPLMRITSGYHYHTVMARTSEILDNIEKALRERGFLIETTDMQISYEPKKYS